MSSCIMKNPDSDEEVDLEALRLAALKSRKPKKYARVNHSNLIPIVPVAVETPDFVNTKIKVEKLSPTPDDEVKGEIKAEGVNKENEDEKASNYSGSTLENDQDILSMDDKEEEDSLERLMDQLEAEISGKAPIPTNRIVLSSKNTSNKKDKRKKSGKSKKDGDDEIELVQVKSGREPGAIIEIRESASPETVPKETDLRRSGSPRQLKSPGRRSRSLIRSRSRSPFSRGKSYRRSRSPYWSKSPRRSRSPFRRSRSPYWMSRRTRSSSRKSRSPFRRYRSPGRKRSPFSRFSRSRSRSFDRRRSPWSLSPRRRSKSPFYRDGLPPPRRRNFNSPGRGRRSFSPRDGSKSPRRRSRSPRRYPRNSPYRRSKSPFRRSRSPFRRTKSPVRRSQSPFLRRSKSPVGKLNSPLSNRSPMAKSPNRRSPSKHRSKSPSKRYEAFRRSPGRLETKDTRSLSISTSPTPRRNRSPLKIVEKNKIDDNENVDRPRERRRNEKRHRSLSRENRRGYRQRHLRRFSPSRRGRSSERQRKISPKRKETPDKNKEDASKQNPKEKASSPAAPAVPPDPVLEARKKKFETLGEVDPTVDKKISLKSIKESTENAEDDEDALTINIESNLWDESEESEDEFESRFKSGDAKKNRPGATNRTVLSFRSLRDGGDALDRKINKPLTEDNRRERFNRSDRHDSWRRNDRRKRQFPEDSRSHRRGGERTNSQRSEKRSDHKPIVWSGKDEGKPDPKDNEVSTTQSEVKESKSKLSEGRGNDPDIHETDDFDKLISDFEKELESDICLSTKEMNSSQEGEKKSRVGIKRDEQKANVESTVKRLKGVKVSEASKKEKSFQSDDVNKPVETSERVEEQETKDGPEDYNEDDDFVLELSPNRRMTKGEEEDSQSDLRAVLSRRRNERLTKAVSLQENMPTRLVQSAFQGLGSKKSKRQFREVQDTVEFPLDRNVKNPGVEGRRVLLLQREKNLSVQSVKCTVPEVKPDTTIYQRLTRSSDRRKRKLQRQLNPMEDLDQEEEEEGFEVEEEKQSRRFRLKRNVTLSSQVQN